MSTAKYIGLTGLACIATGCAQGQYLLDVFDASPPQKGLLVHWEMNENDGSVVSDSSGSGRDGNLVGDFAWQPTEGRYGGALELGNAAYVEEDSALVGDDFKDRFSIALWVRNLAAPEGRAPLVRVGANDWGLFVEDDTGAVWFGGNDESGITARPDLSDGHWHHIVAVQNGQRLVLYVDGEQTSSKPAKGKFAIKPWPLVLAQEQETESMAGELSGMIDDVLLYDRALSAAEIYALSKNQTAPKPDEAAPALDVRLVTLRGRVTDLSAIASLTANGKDVTWSQDGQWEIELQLPNAETSVLLSIRDNKGNEFEKTIKVKQDRGSL